MDASALDWFQMLIERLTKLPVGLDQRVPALNESLDADGRYGVLRVEFGAHSDLILPSLMALIAIRKPSLRPWRKPTITPAIEGDDRDDDVHCHVVALLMMARMSAHCGQLMIGPSIAKHERHGFDTAQVGRLAGAIALGAFLQVVLASSSSSKADAQGMADSGRPCQ